jgi:hypothetical protein
MGWATAYPRARQESAGETTKWARESSVFSLPTLSTSQMGRGVSRSELASLMLLADGFDRWIRRRFLPLHRRPALPGLEHRATRQGFGFGHHHSESYQLLMRDAGEDVVRLQQRLRALEADIAQRLERHQVGKLLTTIDGIGAQTAACIIAELSGPARLGRLKALASYVGAIPRLRQSGKRRLAGRRMLPLSDLTCGRCSECSRFLPSASIHGCAASTCDRGPQASAPRSRSSPPCTNS